MEKSNFKLDFAMLIAKRHVPFSIWCATKKVNKYAYFSFKCNTVTYFVFNHTSFTGHGNTFTRGASGVAAPTHEVP